MRFKLFTSKMQRTFICVVKENNRTTFLLFHIPYLRLFKATCITIFFFKGAWVVYVSGVSRRAINLKICREASDLHSVVRGN